MLKPSHKYIQQQTKSKIERDAEIKIYEKTQDIKTRRAIDQIKDKGIATNFKKIEILSMNMPNNDNLPI